MTRNVWFRVKHGPRGDVLSCTQVRECDGKGPGVRFYRAINTADARAQASAWQLRTYGHPQVIPSSAAPAPLGRRDACCEATAVAVAITLFGGL